jgi:hypothetical protein
MLLLQMHKLQQPDGHVTMSEDDCCLLFALGPGWYALEKGKNNLCDLIELGVVQQTRNWKLDKNIYICMYVLN